MTQDKYFYQYFQRFESENLAFDQVLWVVPRVDLASVLKKQWVKFRGGRVLRTPFVQSADRLSQPKSLVAWVNCLSQLVQVLRKENTLSNGINNQQLWNLASEILTYAMHLGLKKHTQANLKDYSTISLYAEREVATILKVAEVFSDDLFALWPLPKQEWQRVKHVIWFNDGEVLPLHWLNAFMPEIQLHQVDLPLAEGPGPWTQMFEAENPPALKISYAPDEQSQAQQAAAIIVRWLREDGQKEVVVAVVDRLAARWLVPALNKLNVQVDDRTGWQLSTSVVAGWVNQLLQQVSTLGQLESVTHPFSAEPVEPFKIWRPAAGSQALSAWAEQWLGLFDSLGLMQALKTDRAGVGLLKAFRVLQAVTHEGCLTAKDFHEAWQYQVENMRFRPVDANSVVRLTPLLSTRLQNYSRVLVLGCSQSHFQESPPGLLPPHVAFELGIAGPSLARKQKISAIWELLGSVDELMFSYVQSVQGKPEVLLPELQFAQAVLKGGSLKLGLPQSESIDWPDTEVSIESENCAQLNISASAIALKVPEVLHVTALDDWVKCQMRFGLSRLLNFQEDKSLEQKTFFQLRGMFVHAVLEKVSLVMSSVAQKHDFDAWKQPLYQAITSVYQSFTFHDRKQLYPFVQLFTGLVPRVAGKLAWRCQQGWFLSDAEKRVSGVLPLTSGKKIQLVGRIDRLEQRKGQTAIVDIKFKKVNAVKKQVKSPMDNPQLPAYQAILGLPDAELAYFVIDADQVEWMPIAPPSEEVSSELCWGELLWEKLSKELDDFMNDHVWQKTPGEACKTCSVMGICRPENIEITSTEDEPV